MPWDTDNDYDIINQMKIFMGENDGRTLFFDTYIPRSYEMQKQHSIFGDFKTFLAEEKKRWTRSKPLLLVITYDNHYTGIRVEVNGSVTLFDSNYNHERYTPITDDMRQIIQDTFGSKPKDYPYTCQKTKDEADSFCQTWALYLLVYPSFEPPGEVRARFDIIRNIYITLLSTDKGRKVYTDFLNETGVKNPKKYLSIKDLPLDRFVKAMYQTAADYEDRGFKLKY
jgi:hypothetical protein